MSSLDDDWDESNQPIPVPIPLSEFRHLSLSGGAGAAAGKGRAKLPPKKLYPPFNADDWFSGKYTISQQNLDAQAAARMPADPDMYGPRFPPGLDNDKAYVTKYRKHIEDLIAAISKQPREGVEQETAVPHQQLFGFPARPGTRFTNSLVGTLDQQTSIMNAPDSVYASYDMGIRNTSSETLAVYSFKEEILQGLKKHQVLIVEGFTGSGKTTQIPQYILDDMASASKRCNIVVTQPRRIAAQSVADRVCKERGWTLGDLVGYQVGLNRKTTENTRLTYMTTGVLLQTLISKKSLRDYSHIIVDEVHERDLDTDLLILVIKKLMIQTADRSTKIILMSATLNAEKFADYFPKWICGSSREQALIIRIPQTTFHQVYEYYIDSLERPLGKSFGAHFEAIASDLSDEPKLHSTIYDLTVKILEALDRFETNNSKSQNANNHRGGVLAFLPGLMEIDTLYKRCIEHIDKSVNEVDTLRWTLIPLHSSITTEEQQKVFHPTKPGYRKVILATNIAESSITVTDITYVIDFCLTKSISCDTQTNYSCLRMEWASQDQCVQRRGRVGRVGEGHVFRMIPRKSYEQLGKETVPDMEKACLENVILSVKTLDLGAPMAIMALAIDPPALSAIQLAISNLKEVGALTIDVDGVYEAYDGDLTVMGSLMSKLPFDIRYSRLIALGHVFGVLEEAVIIACGLSVKSAFSFPFTKRLLAYMSKLMWSHETFSDCFAIINLYRTWLRKSNNGDFRGYAHLKAWKSAYFVQTNVLREMNLCIQEIIRRLRNTNIYVDMSRLQNGEMTSEQGLMLKIVMAGAFYPNFFVRYRPDVADYARQITRELNSSDPLVTLVYTGFPQEQPGDLYAMHIARRFESINSIPYVKVNGGKVLVQFDHRGDKVGPLSINLFRGVKMRQLRNQVQFQAIRSDLAHDVCEEEMYDALKSILVQCPPQCRLPGITESFMLVSVTRVFRPDSFWVIYQSELVTLNALSRYLEQHAPRYRRMQKQDLIPGSLCIICHDHEYHRARIDYVSTDKGSAMLFLVDVGDSVWKAPSECYAFCDELLNLHVHEVPCLAIECRIYGVKPLARYSGAWAEEVPLVLAELFAKNKNVVVMEVHSVCEGVIACDIFGRMEAGEGKDLGVRETLLSGNLAVEMEEPKPSRDNQNLRRNVHIIDFKKDEIERHNRLQRKDTTPPILLPSPLPKLCTREYTLKGPFSPLEMTFRALSASAHTKAVTVEGCSVNSVALDQDPTSPTSRLLVAAGVGISQKSGSVIARETTLMPPIPGLAPMLTMIFCPTMQLRANSKSSRFTGCLSGLGKDHATQMAVYPDHDMEVVFDTLFDTSDIELINGIRMTMNLVLNGEESSNCSINEMRNSVREDLKKLLERPRPSVEEIYPKDEFSWRDEPRKKKEAAKKDMNGTTRGRFRYRRNDAFPVHSVDPVHENRH